MEEEKDKVAYDEGKRWEQEHLSSALYSFGARDKTQQEVCRLIQDFFLFFNMSPFTAPCSLRFQRMFLSFRFGFCFSPF